MFCLFQAQALQMMQAAVMQQQQRMQQLRQEADGSQVATASGQMKLVEGRPGAQAQWVSGCYES